MARRKFIPDPVLMVISILGITAFLIYWLKQTYAREEKTLAIKTEVSFRETIQQLQGAKLRLGLPGDRTDTGKVKIFMSDRGSDEQVRVHIGPRSEIISTINVIGNRLKDSLKKKPGMIISLNKTTVDFRNDSGQFHKKILEGLAPDHLLRLLYGVDSLQDSLRLKEIDMAYTKNLISQNLNIPFTVTRLDSSYESDEPVFNEVTVGFAHPITYRLSLGNTLPYLIRQITQPILFSILLLGITILSFVLLYRNLLKQQRLAELKNEFISNITHELKTPIATVGVAIEALKNFNAIDDPGRTREYLDISSNELQRLNLLVDKVLKLSMFEKKEVELKYETVDLKGVVEEVVDSLKLQLEKHQATVTVSAYGDLTIPGDRLHLLSVIFNLLDNALKYSKEKPYIQVDMKEMDNNVILTFADNGIGIPPEYKDKVFEKFFRIPHGDTHNAKGYGLGLSYAAQVIQKHGGTIAIETQPGTGTKFTIKLPKRQNT